MKIVVSILFTLISVVLFAQNQTDSKGRKQGEWFKTYPNSRAYVYKGQFKDDKPVGTFTYYYPSTKVKGVIKHDPNGIRSSAVYYHENGMMMSQGIFKNQLKDSVWVNYMPSGRVAGYETYRNGELHGKKVDYHIETEFSQGQRKVAAEYNYLNGKLDGAFKEFFDYGGVSKEGQFEMNQRIGVWTTYQSGGAKMMVERFKYGKRHGWQIAYDSKGNEANRVYYYKGEKIEGKRLEKYMQTFKEKGINPND